MVINPTYLAVRTRSSRSFDDARKRVITSYREWLRAAPEVQSMYSLNMPVSAIRTKIRQEFERHRYVSQLKTVDVLLFNSHQEYQVSRYHLDLIHPRLDIDEEMVGVTRGVKDADFGQETLNFWKQLTHVLKYFRMEEDPKAKLPKTFIQGFLEGRN
ncbi:hypothetical protein LTR12_002946 [Friedmanniomyces endolithicus]|nr:hypothetical protein LTR12_002946 [Friedmanniomyces endolithicus]